MDSSDRFTMSVDYPSSLKNIESDSDTDTIGNDSGEDDSEDAPQYTPPKVPMYPERILHIISPP